MRANTAVMYHVLLLTRSNPGVRDAQTLLLVQIRNIAGTLLLLLLQQQSISQYYDVRSAEHSSFYSLSLSLSVCLSRIWTNCTTHCVPVNSVTWPLTSFPHALADRGLPCWYFIYSKLVRDLRYVLIEHDAMVTLHASNLVAFVTQWPGHSMPTCQSKRLFGLIPRQISPSLLNTVIITIIICVTFYSSSISKTNHTISTERKWPKRRVWCWMKTWQTDRQTPHRLETSVMNDASLKLNNGLLKFKRV